MSNNKGDGGNVRVWGGMTLRQLMFLAGLCYGTVYGAILVEAARTVFGRFP